MANERTFGDWKQPERRITSEFYFDYDILCNTLESDFGDFSKLPFNRKRTVDEEDWKQCWCNERMPRLYLERSYGPNASYRLFIALPHWNVAKEDADQQNKIESSASKDGVFSSDEEAFAAKNEYVHLVYDCDGIDPLPAVGIEETTVAASGSSIEENREIDFEQKESKNRTYYDSKDGCRIPLLSKTEVRRGANGQNTFSGMGRLEVIGGSGAFTYRIVYQFRVNFSLRKVIRYKLKKEKKKVIATVETQSLGRPIEVRLVKSSEGRLPCLKGDAGGAIPTGWRSEIKQGGRGKDAHNSKEVELKFDLKDEVDGENDEFLLDFVDPNDARYFMLLRRPDEKNGKGDRGGRHKYQMGFRFCPYCHEPLVDFTKDKSAARAYRKGVISCQGETLTKDGDAVPIYDEKGKALLTGGMFCRQDVDWNHGMFLPGLMRLLPEGYPLQDNFKINIFGSPRAGKSLLLANVFRVDPAAGGSGEAMSTGATTISTPLLSRTIFPKLRSAAEERETSGKLSAYEIRAIERGVTEQYKVSQSPWTSKAENSTDPAAIYRKYIVGFPPKSELISTTNPQETAMLLRCPFLVRIGSRYVSMYDMSGEDAIGRVGTENQKHLFNGGRMGVIILINGMAEKDHDASEKDVATIRAVQSAFERIAAAEEGRRKDIYNAPVAVVVSKFDVIERSGSGFFSNCNCLRGDVADMYSGEYAGSELEENIEMSSLEIKSYLKAKRPELFREGDFLESLVNCRYFGVSAVQYCDAIRHNKSAKHGDEYNYLRFHSSPKRLELPFLWLFHQFGFVQ